MECISCTSKMDVTNMKIKFIAGRRCWWVKPARCWNLRTKRTSCFSSETASVASPKLLFYLFWVMLSIWMEVFRDLSIVQGLSWCNIFKIFPVQKPFKCSQHFLVLLSAHKLTIRKVQMVFWNSFAIKPEKTFWSEKN